MSAPQKNIRRTTSRPDLFVQLHSVFVQRGYDGATLANLAAATGLSKASLYHHFPGGKLEMIENLVRQSIADLHKKAFSHLQTQAPPKQRLGAFVEGFSAYCEQGEKHCLLAVISQQKSAGDELAGVHTAISEQFADWQNLLADVIQQAGSKPKKARRDAVGTMSTLYGGLVLARIHQDPGHFKAAVRSQLKNLAPI
ncbi:MAG: TetR/AcrR family transcriptional regulator [Pseudomonadota bacterium]